MYRPKDMQERIAHRLKISRGHIDKVIEMVEKDEYCINVIHQSQAIQKALKGIDLLLMEHHLKSCVADAIQKGENEKAVAEVMSVLKKKD